MSRPLRALNELKRRFGQNVDPNVALAMMDEAMVKYAHENETLKQLLMALAFDDGRVRQACKRLVDKEGQMSTAETLTSELGELKALLDLERVELVEMPVPRITQAAPGIIL
jgi:hypothetical protein